MATMRAQPLRFRAFFHERITRTTVAKQGGPQKPEPWNHHAILAIVAPATPCSPIMTPFLSFFAENPCDKHYCFLQ